MCKVIIAILVIIFLLGLGASYSINKAQELEDDNV